MTMPIIPADALDAAKAGIRAYAHVDLQAEHLVEGLARAALEAAAPYMLAGAWEQGRLAGSADKVLDEEYPHLGLTTNPYMLNNEGEK